MSFKREEFLTFKKARPSFLWESSQRKRNIGRGAISKSIYFYIKICNYSKIRKPTFVQIKWNTELNLSKLDIKQKSVFYKQSSSIFPPRNAIQIQINKFNFNWTQYRSNMLLLWHTQFNILTKFYAVSASFTLQCFNSCFGFNFT